MLSPSRESAAEKSRSGEAALTPYFNAVSGRTRLRWSTSARRDSRMRSRTVPVLEWAFMRVRSYARGIEGESQIEGVVNRDWQGAIWRADGISQRIWGAVGGDCERGRCDRDALFPSHGDAGGEKERRHGGDAGGPRSGRDGTRESGRQRDCTGRAGRRDGGYTERRFGRPRASDPRSDRRNG